MEKKLEGIGLEKVPRMMPVSIIAITAENFYPTSVAQDVGNRHRDGNAYNDSVVARLTQVGS